MHKTKILVFTGDDYSDSVIEKAINDTLKKIEAQDHIVVRYLADLGKSINNDGYIFTVTLIHRPLRPLNEKDVQRKYLKYGPQSFKTFHKATYNQDEASKLEEEINQWLASVDNDKNLFYLSKTINEATWLERRLGFFYRMKPKDPPQKEEEAPKES